MINGINDSVQYILFIDEKSIFKKPLSLMRDNATDASMKYSRVLLVLSILSTVPLMAQSNSPVMVTTTPVAGVPTTAPATPGADTVSVTLTPVGAPSPETPVPAPVASATPATPAVTVLLSGWGVFNDKTKAFGPKEEGGKILFSGEGFGTKGKNFAAYFNKVTLVEGQTLRFSADVQFTGISGTGQFRYGIFKKRSADHVRGWMGYCAYAGLEPSFPKGALLAHNDSTDVSFDSIKDKAKDGTEAIGATVIGESLSGVGTFKEGIVYNLVMDLKHVGSTIECKTSVTPKGDPAAKPIVSYAAVDATPKTTTFDAIGFTSREVLSADTVEFSNVTLQLF
jgi:hypothetical protein